jgi:hypothetical protein
MKSKSALLALVLTCVALSCATLEPGADPFVVRVEQTQTSASATIDMILHVDHADRGLWRSNAPAFHRWCEYLRTPQPYGTTTVPRAVAIKLNVDDLKLAFKASRSAPGSNALWSAWSVLNALVLQSASWSNIVSSPITP